MPSLGTYQLAHLRASPKRSCHECSSELTKNYCRECDEFFWEGHDDGCSQLNPATEGSDDHHGHRTY